MKKEKLLLCLFSFLALFMFTNVSAEELEISKTPFVAGDKLTVNKKFNSSSFVAGRDVNVESEIDGISFVAGNTVKVKGTSEYSLVAGNTLEIYAETDKDVFAAASTINVKGDAQIGRDVFLAASDIVIGSNIGRNLRAYAQNIELKNATINGNVKIYAGNITIGDNVIVNGTFSYNDNAEIKGQDLLKASIIKTYEVHKAEKKTAFERFKIDFSSATISFLNLFVLGLIIILLFDKSINKINNKYEKEGFETYLRQLGHGFLIMFATPLVAFLVITTTIGISLSLISLAMYVILLYSSRIILAFIIGNIILTKLFKKKSNNYLSLLIGLFIVYLLGAIPFIGALLSFIIIMLSLGICYNIFKNRYN